MMKDTKTSSTLGEKDALISEAQSLLPDYRVLLYVPNVIGYVRLLLLIVAFIPYISPPYMVIIYSVSIILDGFDGWAARKWNQCSPFGAWMDILIDNAGRGLLWTKVHYLCFLVSVIEWTTHICNHNHGAHWKTIVKNKRIVPPLIAKILSNNFRNPYGVLAIGGLNVLPLWCIGLKYEIFRTHLYFLPVYTPEIGLLVFGFGRILCLLAEIWCIKEHVKGLLINSSKY
ncbi:phosphatidylinositol synthase isoform X2 [Oratosquilla oratoria]|uniref:phosphatidylinositol synthase isoform X2 n=1 Tax=Oratosquilla oratoria TaxID=337810 RepID=UPI003F765E71